MANESICSTCGKTHTVDDLELVFHRPEPIDQIPEIDRPEKVKQSDDLASIGYDRFFVRCVLPLPVEGRANPYSLGVWAEVTEQDFFKIIDLWNEPEQAQEPAFDATLQNRIPHLQETCGLHVLLQLTGPKTRPRLTVPPSEHELHAQQCRGITPHMANEYTLGNRAQV